TPLRIAIADDHAIFREGIRSLFRRRPDLEVVGEAERVGDIEPLLERTRCDLLLLDLQMDRSSLPVLPGLAERAKVVVLTMSERPEDALAAIRARARAVVFKRFALATLVEAIRTVVAGAVWLPPALGYEFIVRLQAAKPELISPREREIIRHVA